MAIIARIKNLLETGETFCMATVIASDAVDIPPGSKAIVLGDGHQEVAGGDTRYRQVHMTCEVSVAAHLNLAELIESHQGIIDRERADGYRNRYRIGAYWQKSGIVRRKVRG